MSRQILVCLLLCVVAAKSPASDNRFDNSAFEQGREFWISLAEPNNPFWHDFSIAPDPEAPSNSCVRLDLTAQAATQKTGIWGVAQEVKASGSIPRYLRGRYYVSDWWRGTARQYVQVVFNLWPTEKRNVTRAEVTPDSVPVQLAFVLTGIIKPPFKIQNRKFTFHGPEEPLTGGWIDFEFDLHAAFEEQWGSLPEKFDAFRVLFEARFDGRAETEKDASATVYFDDLYLGDEKESTVASSPAAADVK